MMILYGTKKVNCGDPDYDMTLENFKARYRDRRSVLDVQLNMYRHTVAHEGHHDLLVGTTDKHVYLKVKESDYVLELLAGFPPLDIDNEFYDPFDEQYGTGIKVILEIIS